MAGSGSLGPPYTTMRSLASRGTARLWHHPTVAFILVIGTSTLRVSGFHISSVFTSTAHTRQIQRNSLSSSAAVSMSTATLPRGGKPLSELEVVKPKLWIYDHCPFCVRPRYVYVCVRAWVPVVDPYMCGLQSVEHVARGWAEGHSEYMHMFWPIAQYMITRDSAMETCVCTSYCSLSESSQHIHSQL